MIFSLIALQDFTAETNIVVGTRNRSFPPDHFPPHFITRMRRRYRELFRDEIAQTVAGADEVDDELNYLFAVLSAGT